MRSDREERGERGKNKKKISVRFPDTLPLGPQPTERLTRGAMRWYWTSLVDGPMPLPLLAAGDGSSSRGQPAASPPFPAPHQPGGWQQAPAHWRTAATPPLPLGWQPPLLVPGARQRVFRPTCSSLLQHHRCGQPLAVSATSCCPISSAPRSHSAARAL